MTFLENFEQMCRVRGESPSHALIAAGLSKSLYQKWKAKPDNCPYGDTIQKLARYFGCSFSDLEPDGRPRRQTSDTMAKLVNTVSRLDEQDQKRVLRYVQFVYDDEMQTL